ncbi:MAG: hypothetical protein ACRCYV_09005 [Aeromonas sp.]
MSFQPDLIAPKTWGIFQSKHNGTFNACIGNNSIHDLNTYADGYIEAAQLLLKNIFEQCLIGQLDTLVHPILYCARHAIELTVKSVLYTLNNCDLKAEEKIITGHSLNKLWGIFHTVANNDSRLLDLYIEINPILVELDAADPNGEDFRYPFRNQNSEQTLKGKSIVDLVTVKNMIEVLKNKLESLLITAELVSVQRNLKTYTQELNRDQLKKLAIDCGKDKSEYFCDTQAIWQNTHKLSKRAFRRAVDVINKHREFSGYMGKENDFIAISDDLLDTIIDFKLNYLSKNQCYINNWNANNDSVASLLEDTLEKPISHQAYHDLKELLTPECVSELIALYELRIHYCYSENYESIYSGHLNNLKLSQNLQIDCMEWFIKIFDDGFLLKDLIRSLALIGKNNARKKYQGKIDALNNAYIASCKQNNEYAIS